jgi:hypothetical protein
MSSRKKAIARIVADEVARETRRQQHRYAADMEPVYIALYENQLAEQRLAQLLAGMASASALSGPTAAGVAAAGAAASTISRSSASAASTSAAATRTHASIYTEHVPEVKGKPCTITFSDNTKVVKLSASYDNIIDAILALWNERERGESKWPVFVKKDTTNPITEWAMLCEASESGQVSVNLMDEVQLPAVYTQAKLQYGSDDLITIHLPASEANTKTRTFQLVFNEDSKAYITEGRNGNCELLIKDLETRERPKLISGTLKFPKLSSSKDSYISISCPVAKTVKDLWVFYEDETPSSATSASVSYASTVSASPASTFKSLKLTRFDSVVFDGSISDLVYQVMKRDFNPSYVGEYTCIMYRPSSQANPIFLNFKENFDNIPQENLVLRKVAYADMAATYQNVANQLLFTAYSETTIGPKTTLSCKPAIAELVQWIAFLEKTGINIDAKEAVQELEDKCSSGDVKNLKAFSTNLYKLYQSTYEAIYYFVKEDMTKYLTNRNAHGLDTYRNTRGSFAKMFKLNFKNQVSETEIIALLKQALGTRCKIVSCFPKDSQSVQELFRAYADAISADQQECTRKQNELKELKLYFEEISSQFENEEAEATTGSSDESWKDIIQRYLDKLTTQLNNNCYQSIDSNAIRTKLNDSVTQIVDADAENYCPRQTATASTLALKVKMERVVNCIMGPNLLNNESATSNYITTRINILQNTTNDYLRFTTYEHLKNWTQAIKELHKLYVSEDERKFLDTETEDAKKTTKQQLLKIAKLYLATNPADESQSALKIVVDFIKTPASFVSTLNFWFNLAEKIKNPEQRAQFETEAEVVSDLKTMSVEGEGSLVSGVVKRTVNALWNFFSKPAGPSWR